MRGKELYSVITRVLGYICKMNCLPLLLVLICIFFSVLVKIEAANNRDILFNKDDDSGKYIDDNSGQYIHDDSGKYIPDFSGQYHHDGTGSYLHKSGQNRNSIQQSRKDIYSTESTTSNYKENLKYSKNIAELNQLRNKNLLDGKWKILRQNGELSNNGYSWEYETENGISASEYGMLANANSKEIMKSTGFYQYTGPDNKVYTVKYTADENGFLAEGIHLPTPPPLPKEFYKVLESLNHLKMSDF